MIDQREYEARLAEAWQLLLKPAGTLNKSGELILADLVEGSAVFTPLPVTNAKTGEVDSHAMAIAEGRRQVALRVIKALGIDPFKIRGTKEILDGEA